MISIQENRRTALRYPRFVLVLGALAMTACGVGGVNNAAPAAATTGASQPTPVGGGTTGNPVTPATDNNSPAPTTKPAPVTSPTPATPAMPGGAPATFKGTVQKTAFTPASATFAVVTDSDGNQTLAVKLSDQSDDCAEVTNNMHHANSNSFWLRAAGNAFAGQSFQLSGQSSDSGTSTATFYVLDSSCDDTLSTDASWATSGSVTFTAVSAQTATGTFQASIGAQGDQVSGTFTATACSALGTLITAPDTPRTCE